MRRLFPWRATLAILTLALSASGEESSGSWDEAMQRAISLHSLGRYEEAIEPAREALEIARRQFGPADRRTADAVGGLAYTYLKLGRDAQARPLYEECLELEVVVHGADSPLTLATRANLAAIDSREERFVESEEGYRKCVEIASSAPGDGASYLPMLLDGLGWVVEMQGRLEEAADHYRKSLDLRRRAPGEALETLDAIDRLASALYRLGRYEEASPLSQERLDRSRQLLGYDDPRTLDSMGDLAELRRREGRWEEAENLLRDRVERSARVLGPDHEETIGSIRELALVVTNRGRHREAKDLLERCLASDLASGDRESAATLGTLSNLAAVCEEMGDLAGASERYAQCLDSQRQLLGDEHPITLWTRFNLAGVKQKQGDFGDAERLMEESFRAMRRLRGEDHPDTIEMKSKFASLRFEQGRCAEAESLYRECLAIQSRDLGEEHPETLQTRTHLALALSGLGRFPEAESALEACVASMERVYGPDHAATLHARNTLVGVRLQEDVPVEEWTERTWNPAVECHARALEALGEEHWVTLTASQNLALAARQVGMLREALEVLRHLVDVHSRIGEAGSPRAQDALGALASALVEAGETTEAADTFLELARRQETWFAEILPGLSPVTRATLAAQNRTASCILALLTGDGSASSASRGAMEILLWRKGLLSRTASRVERIASLSRSADPEIARLAVELATVRSRISFLSLNRSDLEAIDAARLERDRLEQELGRRTGNTNPENPLAAEAFDSIQRSLGRDEALIEFATFYRLDPRGVGLTGDPRYAALVLRGGGEPEVAAFDLGSAEEIGRAIHAFRRAVQDPAGGSNPILEKRASSLYSRIWRPLAPALAGVRRVYISPDGELHGVPFAALRMPDGRYLVEEIEIRSVAGGLALIERGESEAIATGSLVVSSPEYGPPSADGGFAPLPGAILEGEAVASLLGGRELGLVERLAGERATEGALREGCAARPPAILHLATHGYLQAAVEDSSPREVFSLISSTLGLPGSPATGGFDPLAATGLALAGANRPAAAGNEDGRLSALEALGLPLAGTRLVVLSACDTGSGQTFAGEGVSSLASAFHHAGARDVLLTLWPVADQSTRAFMVKFYERYLDSGDAARALRSTQIEFLSSADPSRAAPLTWAGLVLVSR